MKEIKMKIIINLLIVLFGIFSPVIFSLLGFDMECVLKNMFVTILLVLFGVVVSAYGIFRF